MTKPFRLFRDVTVHIHSGQPALTCLRNLIRSVSNALKIDLPMNVNYSLRVGIQHSGLLARKPSGVWLLSGPVLAVLMHTNAGSLRTFQDMVWKILGSNNFKFMVCFTPVER